MIIPMYDPNKPNGGWSPNMWTGASAPSTQEIPYAPGFSSKLAPNSSNFSKSMTPGTGLSAGGAKGGGGFAGFGKWLGGEGNLAGLAQGIGALSSAYLGARQLSLAKDNLRFQKESWAKNYANSVKQYNTSLEDRIRGRQSARESNEGNIQSYLARNRLTGT